MFKQYPRDIKQPHLKQNIKIDFKNVAMTERLYKLIPDGAVCRREEAAERPQHSHPQMMNQTLFDKTKESNTNVLRR